MRTVLVTGAGSGIGLATVVDLAGHGLRPVGAVRSEAKALPVRDAGIETVLLDVTDAAACARVIDELRPDAVVNNAGHILYASVEDTTDDQARDLIEVMTIAPMRIARLALPHMRERGWGRIVNVSSASGRLALPMLGWYSAAKHALEAATDALRMEVVSSGVGVSLVEPGAVKTDITAKLDPDARRDPRYGTAFERLTWGQRTLRFTFGDPQAAAAAIRRAVRARVPLARYVVGVDAHVMTRALPLVPTALRDAVSRIAYGL
jgi:NAD(P)-dependent dehydrogenase (short-subunit alcohol dehydrogenase family)